MDTIDNIKSISTPDKDFCDCPITVVEVLEYIKYLKVNKPPSVDDHLNYF